MWWERRILVVEDEPLVASLICDALNHQGFLASSSPDAIDARAKVDETDPDAALIDIEAALREHQAPTRHDLDNQHAITSLTQTQMEIPRLAAQGMTSPRSRPDVAPLSARSSSDFKRCTRPSAFRAHP